MKNFKKILFILILFLIVISCIIGFSKEISEHDTIVETKINYLKDIPKDKVPINIIDINNNNCLLPYGLDLVDYKNLLDNKKFKKVNTIKSNLLSHTEKKFIYNEKQIEFKNEVLLKNNVIFVELEDIKNIFDIDYLCGIYYQTYITQNGETKMSVFLKKNEYSCEFMINSNIVLNIGLSSVNTSTISESPFLLKKLNKQLIYLPLFDVLSSFEYINENIDNDVKIIDKNNRKNMSWQEIFISVIKKENCEFSLYDFTGDKIPELLFKTSKDIDYLFERASFENNYRISDYGNKYPYPYVCYHFNQETKTLERQFVRCIGYEEVENIALIQVPQIQVGDYYYKWNKEKGYFIDISLNIDKSKIRKNAKKFISYNTKEKIKIEDLVYKYLEYFNNYNSEYLFLE